MKKFISVLLLICSIQTASAKKVKFGVDMAGQTVSAFGVHVSGDFQTIAGFPGGDWASNTTALTNEAGTDIYSIIVDIPAFTKYEYKFVNGDQFYEAEFVPLESRVDEFIDNRWIYVDSLANDTTYVGPILFAGNAPAGLNLIRFRVDMSTQAATDPSGVHVAGIHQGWDPAKTILYSFGNGMYEIINYVTAGTYEYKYYNGNVSGTEESIPTGCAVNGNRSVPVTKDTVMDIVCFAACSSCNTTGIAEASISHFKLFPNPVHSAFTLEFENAESRSVVISDLSGRVVRTVFSGSPEIKIERESLAAGSYLVCVKEQSGQNSFTRLIVE